MCDQLFRIFLSCRAVQYMSGLSHVCRHEQNMQKVSIKKCIAISGKSLERFSKLCPTRLQFSNFFELFISFFKLFLRIHFAHNFVFLSQQVLSRLNFLTKINIRWNTHVSKSMIDASLTEKYKYHEQNELDEVENVNSQQKLRDLLDSISLSSIDWIKTQIKVNDHIRCENSSLLFVYLNVSMVMLSSSDGVYERKEGDT